ncbi:hypothetical protein PTH_0132 [Pelotomaculum thermopropionicum SI]|uniref:Uncharacterized protein n=1 Tax=Pelotomaculum thermopropionicum (strain DSM 13744 / JCM 10971 / SI) TaxID=370438 RepID=A5D614_PELTS|nr:hypothetical protein PTH_0132 [Pelotomaculum thermopropionicum SI]
MAHIDLQRLKTEFVADIFHLHAVHQGGSPSDSGSHMDCFRHLLLVRTLLQGILSVGLYAVRALQSMGHGKGYKRFLPRAQGPLFEHSTVISHKLFPQMRGFFTHRGKPGQVGRVVITVHRRFLLFFLKIFFYKFNCPERLRTGRKLASLDPSGQLEKVCRAVNVLQRLQQAPGQAAPFTDGKGLFQDAPAAPVNIFKDPFLRMPRAGQVIAAVRRRAKNHLVPAQQLNCPAKTGRRQGRDIRSYQDNRRIAKVKYMPAYCQHAPAQIARRLENNFRFASNGPPQLLQAVCRGSGNKGYCPLHGPDLVQRVQQEGPL